MKYINMCISYKKRKDIYKTMKVKDFMQVITNLRFEVYDMKGDRANNFSFRDAIDFSGHDIEVIKIYKIKNELGYEYDFLKGFKKDEYIYF